MKTAVAIKILAILSLNMLVGCVSAQKNILILEDKECALGHEIVTFKQTPSNGNQPMQWSCSYLPLATDENKCQYSFHNIYMTSDIERISIHTTKKIGGNNNCDTSVPWVKLNALDDLRAHLKVSNSPIVMANNPKLLFDPKNASYISDWYDSNLVNVGNAQIVRFNEGLGLQSYRHCAAYVTDGWGKDHFGRSWGSVCGGIGFKPLTDEMIYDRLYNVIKVKRDKKDPSSESRENPLIDTSSFPPLTGPDHTSSNTRTP